MISWIGTVASVMGSFVVALQIYVLGYALFMMGSISWLLVGINRKDKALIILNGFFLCANIIGLWKVL